MYLFPENSIAAEKLADFESKEHPEREAFYRTPYFDENRLYRRRKNDLQEPVITKGNDVKEQVVYIPDEKDPSVLRKAKIVRDAPGES